MNPSILMETKLRRQRGYAEVGSKGNTRAVERRERSSESQRKRRGERLGFGMTTKVVNITERQGGEGAVFLAMGSRQPHRPVPPAESKIPGLTLGHAQPCLKRLVLSWKIINSSFVQVSFVSLGTLFGHAKYQFNR